MSLAKLVLDMTLLIEIIDEGAQREDLGLSADIIEGSIVFGKTI